MNKTGFFFFLIIVLFSCRNESDLDGAGVKVEVKEKINGVSYEMPSLPVGEAEIGAVKRINADWVAMIPYAWTEKSLAKVNFVEGDSNWWGENVVGTVECIKMAKTHGLKVMLKPHVWVVGQGWPGYFDLKTEREWQIWEKSYRAYILRFAQVAEENQVELFSVGTEYRIAVVKRRKFWGKLIKEVREIYSGQVTYASNWDNYKKVKFWKELDYIGIDGYFPLSEKKRPSLSELKEAWHSIESRLEKFSRSNGKPILFTEYGYRSIEYSNARIGKYKEEDAKTSAENQDRAYQALFETIWKKDWMAGGFLWKWHMYSDSIIGGEANRRYTPQGKRVEKTISKVYKKK